MLRGCTATNATNALHRSRDECSRPLFTVAPPIFSALPTHRWADGWVGNGLWTRRQPENKGVCAKNPPFLILFLTRIHTRVHVLQGLLVDAARLPLATCGHEGSLQKLPRTFHCKTRASIFQSHFLEPPARYQVYFRLQSAEKAVSALSKGLLVPHKTLRLCLNPNQRQPLFGSWTDQTLVVWAAGSTISCFGS